MARQNHMLSCTADGRAVSVPPNTSGQTSADKRAEADRRFLEARKRFLSVESNRKLLIELAKR